MSHDPANVLRGHKAAISNPNVSEEAKAHSMQEIQRLEAELGMDNPIEAPEQTHHEHRVAGGYKATITNPATSDKAKAHAQQALEEEDGDSRGSTGAPVAKDTGRGEEAKVDTEHRNRHLGGLKATMHNDRTSDEAKAHAAQELRKAGEAF